VLKGLIGNPAKIGDGPAAVFGDEIRTCHCFNEWGGKAWRVERSESQKTCLKHEPCPRRFGWTAIIKGQVSWVQPFMRAEA